MKRPGPVLLLLALACGDVDEKAACSTSLDCPAGQWCAPAGGERLCWPDAVAPVASDVTIACDTTPCLRDGTLRIEAAVSDDHEVLAAEARLDLDPSRTIALTRAGARWRADVPLRAFPFERFEGPVTAQVVGIDGGLTRSVPVASPALQVTRLRWEYTAPNALTSPAVMGDGTVVMGVATLTDQLLAVNAMGAKVWSVSVGAQPVSSPPAVGTRGIWVAGQDGRLSVIATDGTGVLPGGVVQSDGAIDGASAVALVADNEWGFAASRSGRLVAVDSAGTTARSPSGLAFLFGPVIAANGSVCSVTTVLRCYPFDGAFGVPQQANLGAGVSGALVADRDGFVWTLTAPPATASRSGPAGNPEPIATLPSGTFSDSLAVLADGDLVVGDMENKLHRFDAFGAAVWTAPVELGGIPNTPLVLARATVNRFVVTMSGGGVAEIGDAGQIVWTTSLGTAPLRAPNIYTPPGQPAGNVLSTAYVSSASGKLYAVIVDGELDTSAPWPKAFHDPRNTNNAGTLP